MASPITRDCALRIALAARVLPDVTPAQLIAVLQDSLGGHINERKLAKFSLLDLKTGLAQLEGMNESLVEEIDSAVLKDAVQLLWGSNENPVPEVSTFESALEGSIRIAVASNKAEQLDGHFGSCQRFLVYDISPAEQRLVDVRSTVDADLAEDKNAYRAELIKDCQIVLFISIGGPAAAKIIRAGIYPIKQKAEQKAQESLARLQEVMASSPPPWMAKILGVDADKRTRFNQEAVAASA